MSYSTLVNYFISLVVICSPLSALPALLGLTRGRSIEEKRRIGIRAGIAAGVILVVVTWIGAPLLELFGIGVPAFQIAGGIVVFLLALSMLNAEQSRMKQTTEDQKEAEHKGSIAVVPLAIPILAGPGAISTVIVAVNDHPGFVNQIFFSLTAVLVMGVLAATLYFAGTLEKLLGHTGINIFNRIGGLVLAALAVETLSKGLLSLFPILASHP